MVGQILDPVADRLYILAVVVGLALRDIIPWWLAVSLPLRDLLLWGLVPFLRTRGYSALPVHFLGKAATFNLLYAFPLLLLGDGEGMVAPLAEVFGWAFAIWGVGLYWWAGVLYAWQVRKLLRHDRAGLRRPMPDDAAPTSGPTCPARVTTAADPDHPQRWTRTTGRSRERRAAGRRAGPGRPALGGGRVVVAVFGMLVPRRAVQTSRNADVASRPGAPDRPHRGQRRPRGPAAGPDRWLRERNSAVGDRLDLAHRRARGVEARLRPAPGRAPASSPSTGAGRPDHRRRRRPTATRTAVVRDTDLAAAGQRAVERRRRGDRDQRPAAHRADAIRNVRHRRSRSTACGDRPPYIVLAIGEPGPCRPASRDHQRAGLRRPARRFGIRVRHGE